VPPEILDLYENKGHLAHFVDDAPPDEEGAAQGQASDYLEV